MNAVVIEANGARREVKNLGWLLRHWKEVEILDVVKAEGTHREVRLIARLVNGRRYECDWASITVLATWLDRPVFRGVRVMWNGLRPD